MREPRRWLERITSAGSVFLGAWSPEPMGDYCSGTNHVLPTYGYARAYSGLSVLDFVKRITVQELTPAGCAPWARWPSRLAQLEGLDAHAARGHAPARRARGRGRRPPADGSRHVSWVQELARPDIVALKPYEHASWEPGLERLHANELPWRARGR